MAGVRYEPEVHKASSKEEIRQISQDLHLDCSPAMVEALTEITTGALSSLRVIDAMADFTPEVKYPRTPGYKPEPDERRGNAWAWRCDVSGAPSGKLYGKTFAIKDNCAVAGVPMANGSLILEGYTPEYDATVISRILDAGGRILGKAACDDFCLSAMGFSANDGFLHFPYSPQTSVGGSSGGSGILVATEDVDMAIAGDQGGSIRIPAAYTGTVGFKPTHGLVPYTGLVSIEPAADHVGPITKTVYDCALFLEVIAGSDGLDGRQIGNHPVPEYSKLLEAPDVTGKKLGVLTEGFDTCVKETASSVRSFLNTVGQAGLVTESVSVPLHKHGLDFLLGMICQGALTGMKDSGTCSQHLKGYFPTSLEKAVRQGMQSSANLASPGVQYFLTVGEFFRRRYGNHYYTKARNLGIKLSQAYDKALEHCDVLVMPTLTHTAQKFVDNQETEAKSHSEYLIKSTDMIKNTAPFNLTGHPALSLPLGPLGDGTVDALMIVGRKFDEVTVLQVARALEKIIPARQGL